MRRHNERNQEQNASDRGEQQLDVKFRHAFVSPPWKHEGEQRKLVYR